jgi:hypothetical protein
MVFTKVFKLVNSSGALKVATSKYRPICCVNARETATSTIKVTINVPFHTKFGESVAVAGLNGSWEPEAALTLNWTQGDIWTGEVDLPTGYVWLLIFSKYINFLNLLLFLQLGSVEN